MIPFPETIKKRVTEDFLEIDGRKFKLTSFDPLIGNYILLKITTTVMPFGFSDMIRDRVAGGSEQIPTSKNEMPQINKVDFMELQRDILSHVYEVLPGDTVPVVRSNGTYGISDFTMNIAIQLIMSELAFNFSDFFEENQSEE